MRRRRRSALRPLPLQHLRRGRVGRDRLGVLRPGCARPGRGDLVPDTIFDGFVPVEQAPELRDAVWDGYVAGLAESGAAIDAHELRYLFLAVTALKFAWIPGTAFARGREDALGGHWLAALPLLVSWAEESLELEPSA